MHLSLELVILSILCWNKKIFDQKMFCSAPIYDDLTSCMRSSYTPGRDKTEISSRGENRCKPCRVCKKNVSFVFSKAFSFLNGNYYIAMDLYEYTLEEYLYKLKTDGQDSPLCTNKLVWQFLRGLNSIHQQCLMVHSEIRVNFQRLPLLNMSIAPFAVCLVKTLTIAYKHVDCTVCCLPCQNFNDSL